MRLPQGCGDRFGSIMRLVPEFESFNQILGIESEGVRFQLIPGKPVHVQVEGQVESLEGQDMMLGVCVDDMIFASSSADCDASIVFLRKSLLTKNFGGLTYYAGCVSERDSERRTLAISQNACTNQLVDLFDIVPTSPIPACSSVEIRVRQEGENAYPERYIEAIGGVLWLANTTHLTCRMLVGKP